ncbi:MAG: hypothetical protein KAS32_12480 [Candidatus Peribacteraceae bacterium]|nr:hypothetical protein [Candidatus Peribacteraceae bacterium]
MSNWKVEIRTHCKVCGLKLPNARFRTYCGTKCRTIINNKKKIESGYAADWQRRRREKEKSMTTLEKLIKLRTLKKVI